MVSFFALRESGFGESGISRVVSIKERSFTGFHYRLFALLLTGLRIECSCCIGISLMEYLCPGFPLFCKLIILSASLTALNLTISGTLRLCWSITLKT